MKRSPAWALTLALLLPPLASACRPESPSEVKDAKISQRSVGREWLRHATETLGDLRGNGPALKNDATALAFAGNDAATRAASRALQARLIGLTSPLTKLSRDFDLIIDDGLVIGGKNGTVRVGVEDATGPDGRSVPGLETGRRQTMQATRLLDTNLMGLVPDLASSDTSTRGQAFAAFTQAVDAWVQQLDTLMAITGDWANPDAPDTRPVPEGAWRDPVTGKIWILGSRNSVVYAVANDTCRGLGAWHMATLQEMRAARGRLLAGTVANLNANLGYWAADDGSSSYRGVMRLADGYEAQQRMDLSYAPFDTSVGIVPLCVSNAASPAPNDEPLPQSWQDPYTGKTWLSVTPNAAPLDVGLDACAGLGSTWHLPTLREWRGARVRLATQTSLPLKREHGH